MHPGVFFFFFGGEDRLPRSLHGFKLAGVCFYDQGKALFMSIWVSLSLPFGLFLVLDTKKVGVSIKKSITWVETAMRTQVWVV